MYDLKMTLYSLMVWRHYVIHRHIIVWTHEDIFQLNMNRNMPFFIHEMALMAYELLVAMAWNNIIMCR